MGKMEQNAQEDAAHMLVGTAAQMACIVPPLQLTVHLLLKSWLLLRSKHFQRWVLTNNVIVDLYAQEDAAQCVVGTAALMVFIVLLLLLSVHLLLKSWLLVINVFICDEVENKL